MTVSYWVDMTPLPSGKPLSFRKELQHFWSVGDRIAVLDVNRAFTTPEKWSVINHHCLQWMLGWRECYMFVIWCIPMLSFKVKLTLHRKAPLTYSIAVTVVLAAVHTALPFKSPYCSSKTANTFRPQDFAPAHPPACLSFSSNISFQWDLLWKLL